MSGPCEDCAVRGVFWVREDGASAKSSFDHGLRRCYVKGTMS